MDLLRRWWEDKYRLPWTHETCQDYTYIELLTLFWEDYYHKYPVEAKRISDGKEVKFVTGDPLIDKWEEEIAKGLDPDLTEGLSPEDRAKELAARFILESRNVEAAKANEVFGDGFVEQYGV